jgi:hypothetical protein
MLTNRNKLRNRIETKPTSLHLKTNGHNSIERLRIHQQKMNKIIKKLNESGGKLNTNTNPGGAAKKTPRILNNSSNCLEPPPKLPFVYPLPYLKLVDSNLNKKIANGQTKLTFLKDVTITNEEDFIRNIELPPTNR